jgi:hypothetical protein
MIMAQKARIRLAATVGGVALLAAAVGQFVIGADQASAAPDRPPATSTMNAGAHARRVTIDGARLTLPVGWSITEKPGGYKSDWIPWCLHKTGGSKCLIKFGRHKAIAGKASLVDVDIEGGLTSNPEWCDIGRKWTSTGSAGVADFGGREAEHRRWNYHCADGHRFRIEQYEVGTSPSYVIYSDHATKRISRMMRTIVSTADLPSQKLPVRLFDRGIVRMAEQIDAKHVKIELDRIYLNPSSSGKRYINRNPRTYTYTIKASQAHGVGVGDHVQLKSDGRRVITVDRDYLSD